MINKALFCNIFSGFALILLRRWCIIVKVYDIRLKLILVKCFEADTQPRCLVDRYFTCKMSYDAFKS